MQIDREEFLLFTDGSALNNPGPGGWACLIKNKTSQTLLKGGEPFTTNNKMELLAIIKGLEELRKLYKNPNSIVIFTDSEYALKGATEWLIKWKQNGFKTSSGKPVKNQELWQRLNELLQAYKNIKWVKIKAHSGIKENELVHKIAYEEAMKRKNAHRP